MPRGIVVAMLYSTSVYSTENDTRKAGEEKEGEMLSAECCHLKQYSNSTIMCSMLLFVYELKHRNRQGILSYTGTVPSLKA